MPPELPTFGLKVPPHSQGDIFRESYTLAAEEHPLYEKYQPQFLKSGGQHLVYTLPSHPRIVFKARYDVLEKYLPQYVSSDSSGQTAIEERLVTHVDFEKEKLARMAHYFGREHLVREKLNVMQLPLSASLLHDILPKEALASENGTIEAPVLTRIQEKIEIDPACDLEVCSGYAENNIPEEEGSKETYAAGSNRWIFGSSSGEPFDTRFFGKTQRSPSLDRLIAHALLHPSIRAALGNFLERAIAYGTETGGILDLAGSQNVIVTGGERAAGYLIVDGAYPGDDEGALGRGYEALLKGGVRREPLSEGERLILFDTLNYVRSINGMAEALGLEGRIRFPGDDEGREKVDWERLRELFAASR